MHHPTPPGTRTPTHPRTRVRAAAALGLASCLLLGACVTMPGGSSGGAGGTGPGMNAQGEVTDPRKVEAGHGQKVTGVGGWQGEITGKPAPGSKFTQLKIGMTASEAQALLGPPSDFGAHATAKNFIPFYMGADKTRYEAVYKGQGRLLFASSAGPGNDKMHLIWIIHSAQEDGRR
jgi:hypothetical protein